MLIGLLGPGFCGLSPVPPKQVPQLRPRTRHDPRLLRTEEPSSIARHESDLCSTHGMHQRAFRNANSLFRYVIQEKVQTPSRNPNAPSD